MSVSPSLPTDGDSDREVNATVALLTNEVIDLKAKLSKVLKEKRTVETEIKAREKAINKLRRTSETIGRESEILSIVRKWFGHEDHTIERMSPLFVAARLGDMEGVKALLQCTYDMAKNEHDDIKEFMSLSVEERVNKVEEAYVRTLQERLLFVSLFLLV